MSPWLNAIAYTVTELLRTILKHSPSVVALRESSPSVNSTSTLRPPPESSARDRYTAIAS